jgi:hypothetical protein
VVCDEYGIGGDGERRGGNDAQLGRINMLCHEASGGMDLPCTALFDFEPDVISAVTLSRRSASSPAREPS